MLKLHDGVGMSTSIICFDSLTNSFSIIFEIFRSGGKKKSAKPKRSKEDIAKVCGLIVIVSQQPQM